MSEPHAFARNSASREDPLIPSCALAANETPPDQAVDVFWNAPAGLADLKIPAIEEKRKRGAEATAWRLDNLILVNAQLGPEIYARSRPRLYGCSFDFIQLSIAKEVPDCRCVVGDTIYLANAKGAYLSDLSRKHTEVSGAEDCFLTYIPHAAIGYDPTLDPPWMFIDEATPAGHMLTDALISLRNQLGHIRESEARALAAGLCGLVKGLMLNVGKGGEARETVKAARLRLLRGFLETNLHKPDLGIGDITDNFGVSRSTVFRDFAPDGGLDRYILRRRLERAYIDLTDQPATRGRITQVAESWGFQSMSHFYRVFRAEFGCAPGDAMLRAQRRFSSNAIQSLGRSGCAQVISWMQHIGGDVGPARLAPPAADARSA
jgi:AraC-like DNA-binding protein